MNFDLSSLTCSPSSVKRVHCELDFVVERQKRHRNLVLCTYRVIRSALTDIDPVHRSMLSFQIPPNRHQLSIDRIHGSTNLNNSIKKCSHGRIAVSS